MRIWLTTGQGGKRHPVGKLRDSAAGYDLRARRSHRLGQGLLRGQIGAGQHAIGADVGVDDRPHALRPF